jgi:Zn-dependent protease
MAFLFLLLATAATLLLFVLSFLLHELGHAAAISLLIGRNAIQEIRAGSVAILRWKKLVIGIIPFGGYVRFDEEHISPQDWRLIFVAGPFASMLTGYIFLGLQAVGPWLDVPKNWLQVCFLMAMANFALALFNLAPIPPLDGWKIVESWLPSLGIRLSQEQKERLYKWGMILITVLSFGYVAVHGAYR